MKSFANTNLITGGAGFIGSHLVEKLIFAGEKVICLDDFSTGFKENISHLKDHPNFKFILHDVTQPFDENISVDNVWHLACPASPKKYLENPLATAKINYLGTLNMLEFSKKCGAKFFFASSSEIYGSSSSYPQHENSEIDIKTNSLKSCYSEGKRIAESLCFYYQKIYDLDIRIARIFNTYGPRLSSNDGRVISNFISSGINSKPLIIYGDGFQTRSFCFIDDMVEGIIKLMKSNYSFSINLGSDNEISINDLSILILDLIGNKSEVEYKLNEYEDIKKRKPNIKTAREKLNWYPKVDLKFGLKKTISFFRENLK